MATKHDIRRTSATHSTESPTPGGQAARKGGQADGSEASDNNPPTGRRAATGNALGAVFLEAADPETPVDELGAAFEEWRARRAGEGR